MGGTWESRLDPSEYLLSPSDCGRFQIDERRCLTFRSLCLLSQVGAGLPDPNSGKRRE